MPCSFCYCMSWGFFNILWRDTFPDNNFSSSTNDVCWWPWPLVNMELMSAFTFVHTSAVSTLFLPSLWVWSVFFTKFLVYMGEKAYLSFLYSLCPFSIFDFSFLSSFQLLSVLYFIWYIIPSYSWLHYAGLISSRLGFCFLSHIFSQMKCRKTEHIMQKYPMNKHFFFAFTNASPSSNFLFQTFFLGFVCLVVGFFLVWFGFSSSSVLRVQVLQNSAPLGALSFGCILLFVSPTLLIL